ncbi:MAG: 23S rRNA (adenine(2503)-C(2))-methyltransferase RlmN [Lachnospiraceae bacterium]|nr:23S rRNA (adenine(2503)-C(2))-methyltransferase RlmN [Lachnospiraceae bacterium]
MKKQDILGMYPEELSKSVEALGEKPFRARQIFAWLHRKKTVSFEEMTDLKADFREKLKKSFEIPVLTPERVLKSVVDGSEKYLFRLPDGNAIETMLMKYRYGNSVCVSTQVGCRMGCAFCASTIGGLVRSLTASEILSEVFTAEKLSGEPVTHVVLMGGGEPFDNYAEVVRFLRLLNHPDGRNLSLRNVTLSTSGLPDRIRQFSHEGLPVTLALSLHASDDETRKKLMPVARKYPLSEVLSACDDYFKVTGRRVSYEYAVVKNMNDRPENANALAALLHGENAHVNLIPVNPVAEKPFEEPDRERVEAFQNILEKKGISATIRREIGRDIDGACGQLRYKTKKAEEETGI